MEALSVRFRVGVYDAAAYFSGMVDDVRVFNTIIPTSQIQEQYYTGLNKLLNNGGITKEEYLSRVLDLNNSYAKR
jgi:hypothetical protein